MNMPFLELIKPDEILFIPPEDLELQKRIKEPVTQKNKNKVSCVHIYKSFLGWLLNYSSTSAPLLHPQEHDDLCAFYLSHPRVFVLHRRGQPLPKEWKEQVPPSTLLIVVEPEDWPGHNCFLAQPIPLSSLRQELQLDESKNNKHHGESL